MPHAGSNLLADINAWALQIQEQGLAEQQLPQLWSTLEEAAAERLETDIEPFLVIMLCGPTAVGKSSLINRLAGAEISTVGVGAATRNSVIYVHADDDPERLFEYSARLGMASSEPGRIVRHRCDELRGKVLIDTPDIDSVMLANRELTAHLVHCADLVLFIVSPEKYRNLNAISWIAEQKGKRAVAFVLNKWDKEGLGRHYEQREAVWMGLQTELNAAGFSAPVVFRTTAAHGSGAFAAEDDFDALVRWLEEGLDRSKAVAIQARRRRAAWGRLAARLAASIPHRLDKHPFVVDFPSRVQARRQKCEQNSRLAAATLMLPSSSVPVRPDIPGILGTWLDASTRVGTWLSARSAPLSGEPGPFALAIGAEFRRSLDELTNRADLSRFPLGPLGPRWEAIVSGVSTEIAGLPAAVEMEIGRRTLSAGGRRFIGVAALVLIECCILSVFGIGLWRLAWDFAWGRYAAGGLLLSAIALIVGLVAVGHVAARIFFPPPAAAGRRIAAARLSKTVSEGWANMQTALDEYVSVVGRLADQGTDLLRRCEHTIRGFKVTEQEEIVHQLFAETRGTALLE